MHVRIMVWQDSIFDARQICYNVACSVVCMYGSMELLPVFSIVTVNKSALIVNPCTWPIHMSLRDGCLLIQVCVYEYHEQNFVFLYA